MSDFFFLSESTPTNRIDDEFIISDSYNRLRIWDVIRSVRGPFCDTGKFVTTGTRDDIHVWSVAQLVLGPFKSLLHSRPMTASSLLDTMATPFVFGT